MSASASADLDLQCPSPIDSLPRHLGPLEIPPGESVLTHSSLLDICTPTPGDGAFEEVMRVGPMMRMVASVLLRNTCLALARGWLSRCHRLALGVVPSLQQRVAPGPPYLLTQPFPPLHLLVLNQDSGLMLKLLFNLPCSVGRRLWRLHGVE